MQAVIDTKDALEQVFIDIKTFQDQSLNRAVYHAPIIDHFHPNNYSQKGIAGLSKFRDSVEAEIGYVQGIIDSRIRPKEFTTNASNLQAIWSEFCRAQWPIASIGLYVGGASKGQTKIDIVADGGDEWVKVNTIKRQRLLAEFREQDSYDNSDYDSDPSMDVVSRWHDQPCNSIIKQAQTLVVAANHERRPVNLPSPKVTLILNRLDEGNENSDGDGRVPATLQAIRDLGVALILGSERPLPSRGITARLIPSRHILLDLSVVIALCCDSTHHPLPTSSDELESRFRPLARGEDGAVQLEPHINVTKDLRNQLEWEWSHPLIEELDDRLANAGYSTQELHFWVTQEVKDRMPGIVHVIGGPGEKMRAKALFGETDRGFWAGSRHEGKTKVLEGMRVQVLPEAQVERSTRGVSSPGTTFESGLIHACQSMLNHPEAGNGSTDLVKTNPAPARKSRNTKRVDINFPPTTRAPSAHTLRTMLAGVQNCMTVLTNNRGAVGKVIRDMGVYDGYPDDPRESSSGDRCAVIWVVNPSSLCEWRRLQVEEKNAVLSASSSKGAG